MEQGLRVRVVSLVMQQLRHCRYHALDRYRKGDCPVTDVKVQTKSLQLRSDGGLKEQKDHRHLCVCVCVCTLVDPV